MISTGRAARATAAFVTVLSLPLAAAIAALGNTTNDDYSASNMNT